MQGCGKPALPSSGPPEPEGPWHPSTEWGGMGRAGPAGPRRATCGHEGTGAAVPPSRGCAAAPQTHGECPCGGQPPALGCALLTLRDHRPWSRASAKLQASLMPRASLCAPKSGREAWRLHPGVRWVPAPDLLTRGSWASGPPC